MRCSLPDESPEEYVIRCGNDLENAILKEGPENIAAFCGETMLGALRGEFLSSGYWRKMRDL